MFCSPGRCKAMFQCACVCVWQNHCSLVTLLMTSQLSIHGWEIKSYKFIMLLERNEQQCAKCLSIMHIQCRGSHSTSRWTRLPDLTLHFVHNVRHFRRVKDVWAQCKVGRKLLYTKCCINLMWPPFASKRSNNKRDMISLQWATFGFCIIYVLFDLLCD